MLDCAWQVVENKMRNLTLSGHVGFDSLPDQLVNKSVSQGFCFNILCVGKFKQHSVAHMAFYFYFYSFSSFFNAHAIIFLFQEWTESLTITYKYFTMTDIGTTLVNPTLN